MYEEGD